MILVFVIYEVLMNDDVFFFFFFKKINMKKPDIILVKHLINDLITCETSQHSTLPQTHIVT